MTHRPFMIAMCLLLAAALASAQDSRPPAKKPPAAQTDNSDKSTKKSDPDKPDPAAEKARKNAAVKAMKQVIEDAEFKALPFEDFVEWLGRTTKVNVVVRWKVLEKEGIERDVPITLKEKDLPVSKLLPLVFAEVTRDLRDVELAARASGNIILISTKRDMNSKLVVKTYNVEDLLVHVKSFTGTKIEMKDIGSRGSGITKGGQSIKSGDEVADPNSKLEKRVQDLIDAITKNIEPDSWKVNGGRGTVAFFKGNLVIRNTAEVHQAIGGILGEEP